MPPPLCESERRYIARAPDGIEADIALCHLRGGWPSDAVNAAEIWGYDALLDKPDGLGIGEVCRRDPITRVAVIRHSGDEARNDEGGGVIAVSETNTKISGSFTAAYALDKLVPVVFRALRRRTSGKDVDRDVTKSLAASDRRPVPGAPAAPLYVASVSRAVFDRLTAAGFRRAGLRPSSWSLFLGDGDPLSASFNELTELPQPRFESRADPFLFAHDGATWLFWEVFSHRDGLGRIGVGRLDRVEGGAAEARLVEEREIDLGPGHLSYPYAFAHEGQVYMIPETGDRRRLEIWRATRFPDRWQRHATALEGLEATDSTLLRYEGVWWLFTNLGSGGFEDRGHELHIFRADSPDLKRLEPHVGNPVAIGARDARNGGRPFLRNGALYRPVQMACHGTYGYGLRLMYVEALSLTSWRETEVRRIEPDRRTGTAGCHHLDAGKGLFVLDALRSPGGRRPIALRAAP